MLDDANHYGYPGLEKAFDPAQNDCTGSVALQ